MKVLRRGKSLPCAILPASRHTRGRSPSGFAGQSRRNVDTTGEFDQILVIISMLNPEYIAGTLDNAVTALTSSLSTSRP